MLNDDWKEKAACRGMPSPVFFPELSKGVNPDKLYQAAIQVCRGCPVRGECLAYCLPFEESSGRRDGVWGGLTPRERDLRVWETRRTGRIL